MIRLTELLEFMKCNKFSDMFGKYLIINLVATLSDKIVKIIKNALEFISLKDKQFSI